ncbi:hypothetical protein [Escherichia coli]|uniref:hypothetical protein n=1 Tax=Escherichia coli TaxID=562 RepID=UPI001371CD18|nr:hypothetical protein [Escherichia coli]EKY5128987.1 hypothetical protein [Escherichia coli]MBO0260178.1 hypothetical protein [Escherichia coli]HCQ0486909.1 hypothetical protein [Escherichia coli]HDX6611046.1 hypothetical protein [Escherichia coli]
MVKVPKHLRQAGGAVEAEVPDIGVIREVPAVAAHADESAAEVVSGNGGAGSTVKVG